MTPNEFLEKMEIQMQFTRNLTTLRKSDKVRRSVTYFLISHPWNLKSLLNIIFFFFCQYYRKFSERIINVSSFFITLPSMFALDIICVCLSHVLVNVRVLTLEYRIYKKWLRIKKTKNMKSF